MRVVRIHIAETFLGAFAAKDGFCDLVVELFHALPHSGLAQRLLAQLMPWAQIEVLAAPQFGHPRGTAFVKVLVIPSGNHDKIDRRYAIEAVEVADLVLEVLHELPLAIVALEVCRRETRQKQPRFSETLKDALPPVLHAVDCLLVKKRHKLAFRKWSEVLLNALDELGDSTLLIVVARVADEQVV